MNLSIITLWVSLILIGQLRIFHVAITLNRLSNDENMIDVLNCEKVLTINDQFTLIMKLSDVHFMPIYRPGI